MERDWVVVMNGEWVRISKDVVMSCLKVLCRNSAGETEDNYENLQYHWLPDRNTSLKLCQPVLVR